MTHLANIFPVGEMLCINHRTRNNILSCRRLDRSALDPNQGIRVCFSCLIGWLTPHRRRRDSSTWVPDELLDLSFSTEEDRYNQTQGTENAWGSRRDASHSDSQRQSRDREARVAKVHVAIVESHPHLFLLGLGCRLSTAHQWASLSKMLNHLLLKRHLYEFGEFCLKSLQIKSANWFDGKSERHFISQFLPTVSQQRRLLHGKLVFLFKGGAGS